MPAPLSKTDRAKFKRMMKILDLKVDKRLASFHRIDTIGGDEDSAGSEADTEDSWPRLSLLVRSSTRFDEYE